MGEGRGEGHLSGGNPLSQTREVETPQVGGGLFILAILLSMASGHLRGIYFPRLTERVAAA